jgi:ubiquinone/menaquinone biosynthesis C-methylase UbiE
VSAAQIDNDVVINAWNTVLYEKFRRYRHLLVDSLVQHSEAALKFRSYAPGDRVLDIGCGFGDSTRRIARMVASGGAAVGVDCAENFIRDAADEARGAGVDNANFFVADVQNDDLRGPYDHAFARFGTMFFELPGAAMRNIRSALKPGGTFTQIVWRKREENPWVFLAEQRVRALLPVVAPVQNNQVQSGPGPFSMAGPDMVSAILRGAGFERITFERHDCDLCMGRSFDEAIAFAMTLGPAGEIIRLAGEEGERLKPQIEAALREALAGFLRADGSVWGPSSAWFITATNPA